MLCMVTGAWAQDYETIFSWTGSSSRSDGVASETNDYGKIEGKTASSTDNSVNVSQSSRYVLKCQGKADFSTNYILITLKEGVSLKEGDILIVNGFSNNKSNDSYPKFRFGESYDITFGTTAFANMNSESGNYESGNLKSSQSIVLGEDVEGVTSFKLTRGATSTNFFVTSVEIKREKPDASGLSITPSSGVYAGKVSVSMTANEGYTIYYTDDGSEPSNGSTEYTAPFDVTSSKTIRAIAYKSGTPGAIKSSTYTIVPHYVIYDFTAPTAADLAALRANTDAFSDNETDYISNKVAWTKDTDYALEASDGSDISVANGLLFGRSGQDISIGNLRYYYKIGGNESYALYTNNSSTYIKVPNVAAGQQVVVTVSAGGGRTISASNATPASYSYASNEGTKSYVFTASSNGTVTISNGGGGYYVYSIVVRSAVSTTIGTTGWSTFSSSYALDFSSATPSDNESAALNAYMITGASGTSITKSAALANAPANTGLLINGTAGETYTIPVLASSATSTTGNLMKPVLTQTTVNYDDNNSLNYVLINNSGTPEFQKIVSGDHSSATIAAGKAYLALTSDPATSRLVIFGDEDATAIEALERTVGNDGVFYDLQGRRVANPTKGLYIVNGKKVIIK